MVLECLGQLLWLKAALSSFLDALRLQDLQRVCVKLYISRALVRHLVNALNSTYIGLAEYKFHNLSYTAVSV
jgi:hypothetical protein